MNRSRSKKKKILDDNHTERIADDLMVSTDNLMTDKLDKTMNIETNLRRKKSVLFDFYRENSISIIDNFMTGTTARI